MSDAENERSTAETNQLDKRRHLRTNFTILGVGLVCIAGGTLAALVGQTEAATMLYFAAASIAGVKVHSHKERD